ncbi:hypothetical protein DY000_02008370 [Brassica cretica]|uniref:Uncharacterized protein n=1 Tax=Brassica cretica TaxID=69181 RepID=A0ABQ7C8E9_BRACR|nr:hypothetical protein DY000_02008370 [Brassica cretica]
MSTYCMVIPGEWSSADGRWNFIIDKDKMSRIVPVRPGMNLSELKTNVMKEFFIEKEIGAPPVLSYWPPNTKEILTGVTTAPVIMTNDGALGYFFLHLEAHRGINLFVTFKTRGVTQQRSQVSENPLPFTTPNQPIKNNLNPFRPPSTASSKIPSFSLFEDDDLVQDMPIQHPVVNNNPHHFPNPSLDDPGPPKNLRFSLNDETLSCGDEMLEQMFKEDSENIPDSWLFDDDEETASESSQPPDTQGVPPAAYDHDFWGPLLEEHLGGSDASEVMTGIKVSKTAPHIIHCTTGNAFDHTVLLSGDEPTEWKKDLNFHGVHQRERTRGQSSSKSTATLHSDSSTRIPNSMTMMPSPDITVELVGLNWSSFRQGTELNVYRKLSKLMGSVIWRLPGAVTKQLLERQLLDRETVKGSWPRERNCRGQLQAGFCAERLGWWRNRPSVSVKWDFADQREGHGFLDKKTDKKHRKRPIEINPDRKEGERWPEGRSESRLETAGLSVHCDSV